VFGCSQTPDHATIHRWVLKDSSQLEETFHRRKRPLGRSWRMHETSMRAKGEWRYLCRAVDKAGQTLDVLLPENRDTEAAWRFLRPAIGRHGVSETITIDGSDANEAAIQCDHESYGTHIVIRQVKYVHHVLEQDHHAVTRVMCPKLGFKTFVAAQATLVGIELTHMLKKQQLVVEGGDKGLTAAERFYALAASSPHRQAQLPFHPLLRKICDTTGLGGTDRSRC
jgi:putative transposase